MGLSVDIIFRIDSVTLGKAVIFLDIHICSIPLSSIHPSGTPLNWEKKTEPITRFCLKVNWEPQLAPVSH